MEVSKRRPQSNNRIASSKPYTKYGLGQNMYSSNPKERDTRLNVQRRQKLSVTISEQLTQKLNAYKDRDIVQKEVENLMKKEILNDKDLKNLEKIIIKNKRKARKRKFKTKFNKGKFK